MVKVAEEAATEGPGEMLLTLDEVAREGARRMLVAALEAEVEAYVEAIGILATRPGTPRSCATGADECAT